MSIFCYHLQQQEILHEHSWAVKGWKRQKARINAAAKVVMAILT